MGCSEDRRVDVICFPTGSRVEFVGSTSSDRSRDVIYEAVCCVAKGNDAQASGRAISSDRRGAVIYCC